MIHPIYQNRGNVFFIACFLLFGCSLQSTFGFQSDFRPSKSAKAGPQQSGQQTKASSARQEKKNSKLGDKSIQFDEGGQIHTFRVQRIRELKHEVHKTLQKHLLQVENSNKLKLLTNQLGLPGGSSIEIFSQKLPHRDGERGGHQIVVEMKKVNQNKSDRSIGFFAADSWIEAKNGQVELLAQPFEVANVPTKRFWIGVQCQVTTVVEGDADLAETLNSSRAQLVVKDVVKDSAAELAGVKPNDRIVHWNNQRLQTLEGLVDVIQENEDRPARLGILRELEAKAPKSIELEITPQAKQVPMAAVRTVIVPAAQRNVAEAKIAELQEWVEKNGSSQNQQFRVLFVGPGVNFGREEIELHVDPEMPSQKGHLKKLIDRIAEKKFGVFVKENSFTLKTSPEAKNVIDDLDFEPHEIWETLHFGVNGKTFSFEQLAPKLIQDSKIEIEVMADEVSNEAVKELSERLKTGQIVFPNPVVSIRQELQQEIQLLQAENEKFRLQNEALKAAIQELKAQIKK